MTWGGSLMNWGGFGKSPPATPIERYHSGSGGGYWEHKSHGHGGHKSSGKGGGGGGAALSALALLAFLFLINVMQQSLQNNNATMPATGNTALLLREDQQPISLNARAEMTEKVQRISRQLKISPSSSRAIKGDIFGRDIDDRDHT